MEDGDGDGEGVKNRNMNNEDSDSDDEDEDDKDDNEGLVKHLQCLPMLTWQKLSVSTSSSSSPCIIRTLTYLQMVECHLQSLQRIFRYHNLKISFTSFFSNNSIYNPLSWLNLWISMAISVYTHLPWLFIMPLVIFVVSMAWLGNAYMQHCDGGNSMCLIMIPPLPSGNSMCLIMIPPLPSLILIFLEWRALTSPESDLCISSFKHNGQMYPCVLVHWFLKIDEEPDFNTGMW